MRIDGIETINCVKEIFLELIRDRKEHQKSAQTFWTTNSSRLPTLSKSAKKIFSIPVSSAFVESFRICISFLETWDQIKKNKKMELTFENILKQI
ncbi:hypothetical protein BpHYR1_031377 [Brachionus plicatilis]|uniref:HAT C-terminal dimerisation domain-containing protein n=1 Tax=Brachionus plicatilis TaxID=10195 RepID=A0A3M7SU84_BRAPC|nr:hypothetical protein BpHYR1_031377 [Brachionus plicatilis]